MFGQELFERIVESLGVRAVAESEHVFVDRHASRLTHRQHLLDVQFRIRPHTIKIDVLFQHRLPITLELNVNERRVAGRWTS